MWKDDNIYIWGIEASVLQQRVQNPFAILAWKRLLRCVVLTELLSDTLRTFESLFLRAAGSTATSGVAEIGLCCWHKDLILASCLVQK